MVIIVLVVAVLALGGYFVWQKNKDDPDKKPSASTSQNEQKKPQSKNADQPPADPYAGWKSYSNAAYGISLKYPAAWRVNEVPGHSESSVLKEQYAINLKRSEEVKYNDTVSIEILGVSLEAAAAWHDGSSDQSHGVTKTNGPLKGKPSVQYVVTSPNSTVKRYLFDIGTKTLAFSSINEELNAQIDADYWTKFGKIFDSLEIK